MPKLFTAIIFVYLIFIEIRYKVTAFFHLANRVAPVIADHG